MVHMRNGMHSDAASHKAMQQYTLFNGRFCREKLKATRDHMLRIVTSSIWSETMPIWVHRLLFIGMGLIVISHMRFVLLKRAKERLHLSYICRCHGATDQNSWKLYLLEAFSMEEAGGWQRICWICRFTHACDWLSDWLNHINSHSVMSMDGRWHDASRADLTWQTELVSRALTCFEKAWRWMAVCAISPTIYDPDRHGSNCRV